MLKNYYYVSDQKVESYAAQIPAAAAEQLGAEVTASIGLLSTKLKTLEPRKDRISRLNLVCRFLECHESMGVMTSDSKWVKDVLKVRHIQLPLRPEVFLLIGANSFGEICSLFGSAKHVIGSKQVELVGHGASYFPDFANLVLSDVQRLEWPDFKLDRLEEIASRPLINGGCQTSEVCCILEALHANANSYSFEVEFLGRHVFRARSTTSPICKVFAPVYVALLDEG